MRTQASKRGARSYSDVSLPGISRSVFDRSHSHHTAFNAGDLIPVDREELLPGDTVTVSPSVFARLTTMEVPVFSNVFIDVHYYVVPLRLIWENAEEFFGAEPGGPGTRTDRLTPKLDIGTTGVAEESLFDYIGIPPGVVETTPAHQPHNFYGRAYNLIFNEWYRDAEIDALAHIDLDDSADSQSDYPIRKRRKARDRWTSARPWPQKGPDVTIPLGSAAPVVSNGSTMEMVVGASGSQPMEGASGGNSIRRASGTWPSTSPLTWGNETGLEADLSAAASATVQELRNSIATQHLFEMFARAGSARYTELLNTVYGVRSPDQRLQRPEFVGGMTARLYVNPVSDATGLAGGAAVGDQAAFGIAAGSGRSMTYSATEHCVMLGIASIRTEKLYSEGIDHDLTRHDRFDYHWPAFEAIGEQPIENRRLYWDGSATDQGVFGYEPRYQEYRERFNMLSGKMRPQATNTLSYWHLGELFGAHQNLNSTFLEEDPPIDRIVTIDPATEPAFKVDLFIRQKHIRPISAYGTPGLRRL